MPNYRTFRDENDMKDFYNAIPSMKNPEFHYDGEFCHWEVIWDR